LLLQVALGNRSAVAEDRAGLDERASELEETAARSGSRPLQLNIYGQIKRAMLLRNDGFDADPGNLLLCAQAHLYDPGIAGFPCTSDNPKVCGGDPSQTSKLPAASWQGAVVGARIQF
jgi:hypothetical protein